MSKRVLFLIPVDSMASSRVRVRNLQRDLLAHGIAGEVRIFPRGIISKLRLLQAYRNFDILFIQKKLPSFLDMLLLRMMTIPMVFDFDDAIYCKHNGNNNDDSGSVRQMKFRNILARAKLVIAGNHILASRARELNSNVVVIPSAVETRGVAVNAHQEKSGPCVIGWVGTEGNLQYLELLTPVFQKLAQTESIQVRIVCSRPIEIAGVDVKFVPWTVENEQREIAQFDIGVMPLPNNEHAAGKCGYKALLYMACGVPPVVSEVGINSEITRHGEDGFVARTIDEFHDPLKLLVSDRALRARMGASSRARVEKHYAIEVVAAELARILKSLCA